MFSFDRAADNSLSIKTALAFTGGGCFDYMGKSHYLSNDTEMGVFTWFEMVLSDLLSLGVRISHPMRVKG